MMHHRKNSVQHGVEHAETTKIDSDVPANVSDFTKQSHGELYLAALKRYPNDDAIDPAEEKKLVRKLDRKIIPLLGICYFFYVRVALFSISRSRGATDTNNSMLTRQHSHTRPSLASRKILRLWGPNTHGCLPSSTSVGCFGILGLFLPRAVYLL